MELQTKDKESNITNETLGSVMSQAKVGAYNIPAFQRDYVWKWEQVADLMQSIERGYPIGIITLASAKNSSLSNGKNEIIEKISSGNANSFVVVDGQQRLTSIITVYYAYELSLKKEDLSSDFKKNVDNISKNIHFVDKNPLSTDDEQFWGFKTISEMKEEYAERLGEGDLAALLSSTSVANKNTSEKIKNFINDYKISSLKLVGWSDEQVINIFTAMNKGGKKLTHVDLMNGFMFNHAGLDLISFIKEVNSEIKGTIDPEFMVQLMKIYEDISLEQKSQINYSKQELMKFANDKVKAKRFSTEFNKKGFKNLLKEALKLLEQKYHFYSVDQLPKNVYLIAIFVVICKQSQQVGVNETNLYKSVDDEKVRKIIRLISIRLIEGDYSSSPGVKALQDVNKFIIPLLEDKDTEWTATIEEKEVKGKEEKFITSEASKVTYKNKGAALFKLMQSILISNSPRFIFKKDEMVPISQSTFESGKFDLHHFIPTNSRFSKNHNLKTKTDQFANITLIEEEENRVIISNEDINSYLEESRVKYGDENFRKILESHLFSYEKVIELLEACKNESDNVYKIQKLVDNMFNDRAEHIIQKISYKFLNQEK